VMLPHRSWLSHGILFGTLIRVAYFLIIVTLIVAAGLYLRDVCLNGEHWGSSEVKGALSRVWEILVPVRRSYLIAAFAGLWAGASSHTATDVLGSFFKSVRKSI
ncbi:MAG TPA: DUF2227 family putative metal-binding protein, partial [Blastocatellia bacterium]